MNKVYFIQAGSGGPIKIGWCEDVLKRTKTLQSCHWLRLNCLGFVRGSFKAEQEIHREFDDIRIAGEWFKPDKKLLRFIKRHATKTPRIYARGKERRVYIDGRWPR